MGKFLLILGGLLFSSTQCIHSLSQAKLDACNACHGQNGISSNGKYPNLAGQHKKYMIKQLHDMKTNRLHCPPIMKSQLALLDEQDLDELANHYSKMPLHKREKKRKFSHSKNFVAITPHPPCGHLLPIPGEKEERRKLFRRGKTLYTLGDYEKKITACIICHGPKGLGNEEAGFPVLAGQSPHYIREELQAFQRGKRSNDLNGVMQTLCSQMSLDDIKALANYIEHF